MEKKKYQNPTMEEIEVKYQLLTGTGGGDTPDGPESGSRSVSSSFSDAE